MAKAVDKSATAMLIATNAIAARAPTTDAPSRIAALLARVRGVSSAATSSQPQAAVAADRLTTPEARRVLGSPAGSGLTERST